MALALELQIERLPVTHRAMRVVQTLDDVERSRGTKQRLRAHQREKTQRTHRVAGIDRLGDAVHAPQRAASVTKLIAILDVVVNQRIVVQQLHRGSCIERMLERRAFGFADAHEHRRAQTFSTPRRPVWRVTEVVREHFGDRRRSAIFADALAQMGFEALETG